VQLWPPLAGAVESAAVTVYRLIAEPPRSDGAVQVTVANVNPGVAVTAVGVPGTVPPVIAKTSLEAAEDPIALTALTVK
jgi:hypothetical protein